MDAFVLILDESDGSETCLYQEGTEGDDAITAVLVAAGSREATSPVESYPSIVVAGTTAGALAGTSGEVLRESNSKRKIAGRIPHVHGLWRMMGGGAWPGRTGVIKFGEGCSCTRHARLGTEGAGTLRGRGGEGTSLSPIPAEGHL